jgi:hypothetical protein
MLSVWTPARCAKSASQKAFLGAPCSTDTFAARARRKAEVAAQKEAR